MFRLMMMPRGADGSMQPWPNGVRHTQSPSPTQYHDGIDVAHPKHKIVTTNQPLAQAILDDRKITVSPTQLQRPKTSTQQPKQSATKSTPPPFVESVRSDVMESLLGKLPQFMTSTNRKIVNVPGDGNCGYHSILAQTMQKHENTDIDKMKKGIGATGMFDTRNTQLAADYCQRPIIVLHRNGDNITQLDLVMPKIDFSMTLNNGSVDSESSQFDLALFVQRYATSGGQPESVSAAAYQDAANFVDECKKYLPDECDTNKISIKGAITQIMMNEKSVVIVHSGGHYMAAMPIA
jgi:hypothetical protein